MSVFVRKLFFVLLILSVSVAPVFVSEAFAVEDGEAAAAAVELAEEAMVTAYEAVLDAEEAGASVSGLVAQLSVGGEHLAEARVRFGLGDFETVSLFAGLCYDVAEEVRVEAEELRSALSGSRVTGVVVKTTGSVVGVIVVVFLGFAVWRVFKQRYRKEVLEMKPEVVSDGS